MKHVVRVVIAVLVVALLGYLVYFFAFKPDPDNSTFRSLVSLNKYEDSCAIRDKADVIHDLNGLNAEQQTLRDKLTLNTNSQLTYYGYIEKSYDYYFGYTEFVKNVKRSSQQDMNTKIKNYRGDLGLLKTRMQDVIDYKETGGSGVGFENEMTRYMELMIQQFVKTNKAYCALVEEMKGFVEQYVFKSDLIEDAKSAQLDVLEQSVAIALSKYNFDDTTNYDAYRLSVVAYNSKTNNPNNQMLDYYLTLNISSTKDGKGDTYLTKLLKLTNDQQKELHTNADAVSAIFPDQTLADAALALLTYYGIN